MRFSPRDDTFFELFTKAAGNIDRAAQLLRVFIHDIDRREELAKAINDCEHIGDDITHEITMRLNTSFMTPFDHEDIYALAVGLDDVADLVDAGSDHVVLYKLGALPERVRKQVELITELAAMTAEAMPRLRKVATLSDYWEAVKTKESEADHIHRRMLAELFSGDYEALDVLKLKEVTDDLEDAINAFERIAYTIEAIAIKES